MENVLVVLYQETKEIVLQHFLNILWNYGKGKRAICIYGKRTSKSNYVPCSRSLLASGLTHLTHLGFASAIRQWPLDAWWSDS